VKPVNIKEAIEYCVLAWDEVSYKTIKNYWHKTEILLVELDHNDLSQKDTLLYDKYLDDENEVDYLIEQLPINTNNLLSASEYIKIDNNLSTTEIPSSQEILATFQEKDEDISESSIQIPLKTALE
ncbi:19048_t:CDS:1, partial [Dentiscutata erythropus]